jgi:hypothetical protein
MLSDVNGTKRVVTSEAGDVARRACGDCFVVSCMFGCGNQPEVSSGDVSR